MSMNLEWKKIREEAQRVGYKTVIAKFFTMPDGTEAEFTTWGKASVRNAGVVAVTKDKRVVIARQFRSGPERVMEELPGGGVDDNEEPAAAALRELEEETGYTSDSSPEFLGVAYRDAYMNDTNHYFLLTDCYAKSTQALEANEFIEVVTVPIDTFIANAKEGKMTDSVAVLMALDRLREIQSA